MKCSVSYLLWYTCTFHQEPLRNGLLRTKEFWPIVNLRHYFEQNDTVFGLKPQISLCWWMAYSLDTKCDSARFIRKTKPALSGFGFFFFFFFFLGGGVGCTNTPVYLKFPSVSGALKRVDCISQAWSRYWIQKERVDGWINFTAKAPR